MAELTKVYLTRRDRVRGDGTRLVAFKVLTLPADADIGARARKGETNDINKHRKG